MKITWHEQAYDKRLRCVTPLCLDDTKGNKVRRRVVVCATAFDGTWTSGIPLLRYCVAEPVPDDKDYDAVAQNILALAEARLCPS